MRPIAVDANLHLLNDDEMRYLRRSHRTLKLAAALLSVLGFLSYYLPVYWFPQLFPAAQVTLPILGAVRAPWGELLWGVLLTTGELVALVLLNITGVHEVAVATGFIKPETKEQRSGELLRIGLEKKSREVSRYGIDPYQGLSKWALFLFNLVLRLKGWLANQVVRYLLRVLLGRYAVRSILDFSGLPIYMAINLYSCHAVMREARVIIMGRTLVNRLVQRLPRRALSSVEADLLYDTLQYIAVSKRDFHQNHYLLTRQLIEHFSIASRQEHQLPASYLTKLQGAPAESKALCQLIILLGFILDGALSWRERLKLRALNQQGVLQECYGDLQGYLRDFMQGAGVDEWSEKYVLQVGEIGRTSATEAALW